MHIQMVDDQPISATFFGEGKYLTEFITPENLDVQALHKQLTEGLDARMDRVRACWQWVACQVKYKKFINGVLRIGAQESYQDDVWMDPSLVIRTREGNCANKSFLLASLLMNELDPGRVKCVLGNLYNGKVGGHAWVEIQDDQGQQLIMESTRCDIPMFMPVSALERYEAVHFFDHKEVYAVPGRTVMEPFTACFSTWLRDYLNWDHINSGR